MVFLEGKGMCGYVSHGSKLRKVLFGLIVSLKLIGRLKLLTLLLNFQSL